MRTFWHIDLLQCYYWEHLLPNIEHNTSFQYYEELCRGGRRGGGGEEEEEVVWLVEM